MYIVYLMATMLAADACQKDLVVNIGPYLMNRRKYCPNSTNYTLHELDEMFTTFHSFDSIMRVFQKPEYEELIEIKELMQVYKQKKDEHLSSTHVDAASLYPFIMIDGFQSSGKVTIGKRLHESFGASFITVPPSSMVQLRIAFDSLNFELRSAFYALVNYLVSYHVMALRSKSAVIVTRYWHSLTAYVVVENEVYYNLSPDEDNRIYAWPSDLLKPDVVYLLNSASRYSYISHSKSIKIANVYRKIKDPAAVIVAERDCENFETMYSSLFTDIALRFNLSHVIMR